MCAPRVFVLGLDCATPQLLFERYRDRLPHFRRIMAEGAWGRLASCHPPITVPAWTCLFSGRDPGELGLYGFRNRTGRGYQQMAIADSRAVRERRVWDYASEAGLDVVVLGVPPTYPPSPVKGVMVSCFLTPSKESTFTYPPGLKGELDALAGDDGYIIDVEGLRTEKKQALYDRIVAMTRRRFNVARAWATARPWNLFCMVEMGPDRIHHGFWRFAHPEHRLYQAGNAFEHVLLDYYRLLDEELGLLLQHLPPETSLFVVSDHGARTMSGGICINEWLMRQGLLRVRTYPDRIAPLDLEDVVWSETKAWGEGGYFGRVFLNVRGREPQGIIPTREVASFREELADRLRAIPDADGKPIGTIIYTPEEIYRKLRGIPPDLLVYFGNLSWRSVGSLGHREIHTFSNDTGPDDANHDYYGVFLARDKKLSGRGELTGISLYDLLPTLLERLKLPIPGDLIGRAF